MPRKQNELHIPFSLLHTPKMGYYREQTADDVPREISCPKRKKKSISWAFEVGPSILALRGYLV